MGSPPQSEDNPAATAPKDAFALPSREELRQIERRQNERAQEIRDRRARELASSLLPSDDRTAAAQLIQRNYRGYRDRRALQGHGLDASTRWMEAMKDVRYEQLTRPSPSNTFSDPPDSPGEDRPRPPSSGVRDRWRRAEAAAHRAGSDDTSASESEPATCASATERAEFRARRRAQKAQRERYAQVMGLEYFLEMVDQKHRYGSNLRRYHREWQASDTRENFFWWLDHGEGKDLDLPDRPRSRLDTEQVRYLSREERRRYLVRIDDRGRFVWDRNGEPITTSPAFKDSVRGIVPVGDRAPSWREVATGQRREDGTATGAGASGGGKGGSSSDSDGDSDGDSDASSITIGSGSPEDGSKYTNPELHEASGLGKVTHLSVDALMNHLLRKTTKSNTWIFVADTSFRLYIGIKQSGAFQHSSFLKGARVAAAGLIRIKRGQIRKLSPLSGHYAPPVRNFREFLRNLREEHADLSRLNVSRSYAVILGLEGYLQVKRTAKDTGRNLKDLVDPGGKKKREEEGKDKSRSAEMERKTLAKEERERKEKGVAFRVKSRLGLDGDGK